MKNKRNEKDWYKQLLKYFLELRLHIIFTYEETDINGIKYESKRLIFVT